MKSQTWHIAAVFIAVLLVVLVFCASCGMEPILHHDCSGEGCPVCEWILTIGVVVSHLVAAGFIVVLVGSPRPHKESDDSFDYYIRRGVETSAMGIRLLN